MTEFDSVRHISIVKAVAAFEGGRTADVPDGVSWVGRPVRDDLYVVLTVEPLGDLPRAVEDFDPQDRAEKIGSARGSDLDSMIPLRMNNDATDAEAEHLLSLMRATDIARASEIRDHWRIGGQ